MTPEEIMFNHERQAQYEGVEFGAYCIVHDDVEIGPGTKIGSYVELRPGTRIGNECNIDSYVVTSGDCRIGDGVTLRYGTVIARGCDIGNACYFGVRVMTNNLDHQRRAIGGAIVKSHCFIGTHAVLGAGITIARNTVVGACALVTKDIQHSGGVYVGVPARRKGS